MLSKTELELEELTVLALMAGLADEGGIFHRRREMKKLHKLLFLAVYGERGSDGGIRLRDSPRLRVRFHVYLYGVASKDVYSTINRLEGMGLLERVDVDVYRVKKPLSDVLAEIKKRSLDLYEGLQLALMYRHMTDEELEGFVNGMLGLGGPAIKAMVYGVEVQKLLDLRRRVRELEEEGLIVDV